VAASYFCSIFSICHSSMLQNTVYLFLFYRSDTKRVFLEMDTVSFCKLTTEQEHGSKYGATLLSSLPHTYTARKICASLCFVTVRGERKRGRARVEQDVLCAIVSPPSPYLDWLAANVCICNGQRSSEISCDKFRFGFIWVAPLKGTAHKMCSLFLTLDIL
jgi:hypothetical protein